MSEKTDNFIKTVGLLARNEFLSRDQWILPSVCIAQGALESGWNLNARSLFGIKGNGFTSTTSEFYDGHYVEIQDCFREYPDLASSIIGYYDFLRDTPRYERALNNTDYKSAVDGLLNTTDGLRYATDPNYYDKIVSIIEDFNLTEYDLKEETSQDEEPQPEDDNEPTIEPQEATDTYTVQPNDCLSVIGENLGIDWKTIADINGISEPYEVFTGQVLKLVADTPQEEPVEEPQAEEVTEVGLVEQVQKFINSYGFGIDEDNIYGQQTKEGLVKAYQQAMNDTYGTGLEVDGIFGQQSRNSANNLLTIGISNDVVKVLQASLQVYGYDMQGIDGIFGYLTNSSVLDFQANHGLEVDGIVGVDTWSELFN